MKKVVNGMIKYREMLLCWLLPGYSSDGRAIDCRSIGPVFDSQCPDLNLNSKEFVKLCYLLSRCIIF